MLVSEGSGEPIKVTTQEITNNGINYQLNLRGTPSLTIISFTFQLLRPSCLLQWADRRVPPEYA